MELIVENIGYKNETQIKEMYDKDIHFIIVLGKKNKLFLVEFNSHENLSDSIFTWKEVKYPYKIETDKYINSGLIIFKSSIDNRNDIDFQSLNQKYKNSINGGIQIISYKEHYVYNW